MAIRTITHSKEILSVILGGGAGTRLYPLTASRSKPAVPIAGKYRLVDIPISNCLNNGIGRMFVLTVQLGIPEQAYKKYLSLQRL
jgi:glucose-1-phosphate adenylyltransferase